MQPAIEESWNLDHLTVNPEKLPYQLDLLDYRKDNLVEKLRGCRVVLAMIGYETSDVSRICRSIRTPSVYFTEYTLKTRLQIAKVEEKSPLARMRRLAFELNQERRNQQALRLANGVQCNGTPTFDAYRSITDKPHLYFDSRLRSSSVIDEHSLEKRLAGLDQQRPLHLVYSGRLDAMKGVLHLPRIGHELRLMGVDFKMTICGGGKQAAELASDIRGLGLSKQIRMAGVLDFEKS